MRSEIQIKNSHFFSIRSGLIRHACKTERLLAVNVDFNKHERKTSSLSYHQCFILLIYNLALITKFTFCTKRSTDSANSVAYAETESNINRSETSLPFLFNMSVSK